MRGRPPTPTGILELRGAFRKHPERRRERENEPKPEPGVGKPPKELDVVERALWKAMSEACTWLTVADRWLLAMTCRLAALEQKRALEVGEMKLLQSNYVQLGMSPAGRPRIQAPKVKAAGNPFSGLRKKA